MSIRFIDLKYQYESLKPQIQDRINKVLEHGQYIMGPEVKELEDKYPGLEDVFLQWPEGMPLSEFSEQLEIFSQKVIPAFNNRG